MIPISLIEPTFRLQTCFRILNTDVEGFERTHLWEIFVMLGTLAALSLFAVAANGLILMVLMKNR